VTIAVDVTVIALLTRIEHSVSTLRGIDDDTVHRWRRTVGSGAIPAPARASSSIARRRLEAHLSAAGRDRCKEDHAQTIEARL
jgi:hypothetical protein